MVQTVVEKKKELPATAIGFVMIGITGGLGLDLAAKQLLSSYPLQQFVFLRSLIGVVLLLLVAPRVGGVSGFRTRRPGWHLLRTLLACGAMFGFFYGLSVLPLVAALAIAYTAPLMMR